MAFKDSELPDQVQAEEPRMSEDMQLTLLAALGESMAAMRKEAVDSRRSSGLEEIWKQCEEAYLGIDDANRHQFQGAQWFKPNSMNGNLTQIAARNNTKSTAFVRLTSRYVDMGAAKISEIILPIDDKAFTLGPTPIPDLVSQLEDKSPLMQDGKQVFRPLAENEPPPAAPLPHGMVPATVGDRAKAALDRAGEYAEKAEKRIYDWMLEAKYPKEMRKVEHDSARLGVGILKCPYPVTQTNWARVDGRMKQKTKIVPGMRSISPWNFYPHGSCAENIHDGDYVFECDDITTAKLKKLREEKTSAGVPIYIASQIDKVLEEGPDKCNLQSGNTQKPQKDDKIKPYKIWYFTGTISRNDMATMNPVGLQDLPDDVLDVNAMITMVNDSVIRATRNPLESGGFPYRLHSWSRRDGSWAGVGVAEQVFMPQRTVNAGTRALLNNAGITAGGQIVVDRSQIEPADGQWNIVPNKIWWTKAGSTGFEDIRKVFMSFEFPNMGSQLQALIDYGFKLAEEASNIPLVTQGRDGQTTPQTFGAAELQNTNAHTLLRAVAYDVDDSITEPVVKDLYEWLLLDDDVPDDEKGDFAINATGSIAMVERAIQEQVLAQMLPLSKDPAYGWNPKKLAARFLKAKRIDARDVDYTEEELQNIAKQPQPEDPVIAAAKIRAASAEKVAVSRDQASVKKSELDLDRDTAYQEALNERARIMGDGKDRELQLRKELEVFKENNSLKKELDKIKAELAQTSMKLQMTEKLSLLSATSDKLPKPPIEPAGRAPAGQSFPK